MTPHFLIFFHELHGYEVDFLIFAKIAKVITIGSLRASAHTFFYSVVRRMLTQCNKKKNNHIRTPLRDERLKKKTRVSQFFPKSCTFGASVSFSQKSDHFLRLISCKPFRISIYSLRQSCSSCHKENT